VRGWEIRLYPRSLYFRVGDFFLSIRQPAGIANAAVLKEDSIFADYFYNSKLAGKGIS